MRIQPRQQQTIQLLTYHRTVGLGRSVSVSTSADSCVAVSVIVIVAVPVAKFALDVDDSPVPLAGPGVGVDDDAVPSCDVAGTLFASSLIVLFMMLEISSDAGRG